ncbi:MAG: polysulfide reductase NrfD [Chloroflexi bacterium]|nr:polysulfide reductase NrfD [Chloroflexota bacterium]
MVGEFVVTYDTQREWRYLILIAFVLGGLGAGLFMISQALDYIPGMIIALLIVIGKGIAHLLYLGHPERFFRAFVRPQSSWISRGMIGLGVFMVFGVLYTASTMEAFSWLPWAPGTLVGETFRILAILSALWIMLYTGFVMAAPPSIPFWNTTLLPILFIIFGFMGGIDILFILAAFGSPAADLKLLETVQLGMLMLSTLVVLAYVGVMNSSTVAAKEAVRRLIRGELASLFIGGVFLLGLIVPLAVTFYVYSLSEGSITATAIVGLLTLIGSFLLRWSVLRSGVYAPLL